MDVFKNGHRGVDVTVTDRQETPAALICSVKMRYTRNGVPMLTKSGFRFDGYSVPHFHSGLWTISDVTSVTGPEEQFPQVMRLGAVVLSSRHWDPQFFEQYREVVDMLLRQARVEGQVYLDAQFAALRRHFHDLSESNRAAFAAQEAAKDKSTRDFCDYVLDRQRYTDGHTDFILPSGYSRAATNGTEYVLTNAPDYRATGNWRELNKVR